MTQPLPRKLQFGFICLFLVLFMGTLFIKVSPTEAAPADPWSTIGEEGGSPSLPTPENYTVTFDTQGGGSIEEQVVASGSKAAEPSPAPERSGYVLAGWYTESQYGRQWIFDTDTVSQDITLYAQWTEYKGFSINGRIIDAHTKLGINGATVRREASGADSVAVKTDDFGFYRLDQLQPGTYNLYVEHAAYIPVQTLNFEVESQNTYWDQELVPLDPGQTTIDIYVETGCVSSGIQLEGVPVTITVVTSSDQTTQIYSDLTDRFGVAQFLSMPKGFYTFSINEGDTKVMGWDGFNSAVSPIAEEITASHWVDCMLKPEYRMLTASVYGYDPVQDLPNQPLGGIIVEASGRDPRYEDVEVIPPQVGVSGIKKDAGDDPYNTWNNLMAGKVIFEKLIPISWLVETKRMGYIPSTSWVRTDAQGNFDQTEIRFDIDLEPTKLLVVLDSPYNDSEMLDGLEVSLSGLDGTNTAGILRKRPAQYKPSEDRTVALFENILPGDYRIAVSGSAEKTVPILVEGKDLYNNPQIYSNQPRTFKVHFSGNNVFYAGCGETTEAALDLEPEKMKLKGTLYAVDEQKDCGDKYAYEYMHYPVADKQVEIYPSEYYRAHMPEGDLIHQIITDCTGAFEAELYPGLYGVKINAMDDYWGNSVEFNDGRYSGWPYYQIWPYSYDSALAYMYRGEMNGYDPAADLGGMALSSGPELAASFFVRKDCFTADIEYTLERKDPTKRLVNSIDRSKMAVDPAATAEIRTSIYDDLKNGGTLTLHGPGGKTINLATEKPYFIQLQPGSFSVSISHPRYQAINSVAFEYFDFPSPGNLPGSEFPANYNQSPKNNPWPMLPWYPYTSLTCEMSDAIKLSDIPADDSQKIKIFKWQQVSTEPVKYDYVETGYATPHFIKPEYTGERIFTFPTYYNGAVNPFEAYVPNSKYEAWFFWAKGGALFTPEGADEDTREHWYQFTSNEDGCLSGAIYILGPTPTLEAAPLAITYDLEVVALDSDNRNGSPINGVAVSLRDGLDNLISGENYENQTRDLQVTNAVHAHWNWPDYNNHDIILDYSAERPKIKLIVYMEKGIALRGEVRNSENNQLIDGASWRICKAQGNEPILMTEKSGQSAPGKFSYPYGSLNNSVYFIDFKAPGYEPYRRRLDPADAVQDPNSTDHYLLAHILEGYNAVQLKPLIKPQIMTQTMEMDRFGAFIPGIRRAGNQQTFNALDNSAAEARLTMNWSLQGKVQQDSYTVTLPQYDTATGPSDTQQLMLNDEIAEIWVIDRKSFPDKTYKDEAVAVTVPSTEADQYEPQKIHRWLEKIKEGDTEGLTNVYYQRIGSNGIADLGTDGLKKLSGKIPLWKLPPDDFRPTFVVVSKLGAVEIFNFDYAQDSIANLPDPFTTDPTLVGMRVPEWFGTCVDVMSYAAKATAVFGAAAKDKLQKTTPTGSIMPLPAFTADIVPRADKCLDYVYRLNVEMLQGSKTPSNGMLGLAPGMMGFSVFGEMKIDLKGADKEFFIQTEAGLGYGKIDLVKLTPKLLSKLGVKPELDPMPLGRFYHIDDYFFDKQNYPTEKAVVNGGSGEVGMKVTASAFQALGPIPKVGWVLLALKNSGVLDAGVIVKGSMGVRGLFGYKTIFPQNIEHYDVVGGGGNAGPETRQLRRTFVGGNERDNVIAASEKAQNLTAEQKAEMGITETTTKSLDVCVNFGVGLYVNTCAGHVGAEGSIEVAGDDSWTRKPSLFIVVNPNGDAPIINQIKGDVRATTDIYVNLWLAKMKKHYIWTKIPINYEYKTDTSFAMIPLEVTVMEKDRNDFGPSTFHGSLPLLIEHFLEIGDYATDSEDSDAFVYPDMATQGGDMRLMISQSNQQDSLQWNEPKVITQTEGAIVSHDLMKIPGTSEYLAVWTEIAENDIDQTCPPSVIKYARSDSSLSSWTTPAEVTRLNDVAAYLELVRNGNDVALVTMNTTEGPMGINYRMDGFNWHNLTWSPAVNLVPTQEMIGMTACGTDYPSASLLTIAYVNKDHELVGAQWHSDGSKSFRKLADHASNDVVMDKTADGHVFLVWSSSEQGIGLFSCREGVWQNHGFSHPYAMPQEMDMKIMADGNLLLSWTEGEAENVWSSILDTTGQVLVPPTLFGGSNGKHASPRIINTVKSDGSPVIYMLALSEDTDLNLVSYKVYDSAEKPLLGGNIRITGTPRVGSTLNVDNSGLLNQKGSLIYQWKRDGELILTNGNGDTYIPIEADIGKQISITVTAAENTGSVTSPPTAAVEAEQEIDECFIATAAFGSKFTWPVVLLRQFRDQYLLQHTWGKAFVTFYYQHSPRLASFIAGSPPLKTAVKILLAPMIALVFLLYHPWLAIILGLIILLIFRCRIKIIARIDPERT